METQGIGEIIGRSWRRQLSDQVSRRRTRSEQSETNDGHRQSVERQRAANEQQVLQTQKKQYCTLSHKTKTREEARASMKWQQEAVENIHIRLGETGRAHDAERNRTGTNRAVRTSGKGNRN